MKVFLSTILSLCCLSTVYSQIEYDLSIRLGNSITSSESFNRFYLYDQSEQITEDQYVKRNITSTNNYETIFTKLGRFEVAGSIVFPVSHGLHIRTGLGVSHQMISLDNKYIGGNSVINSVDTLMGEIPKTTTTNPNFKPCQYENSFTEIIIPSDASSIWSLLVPLELEYDIIDRLAIRAGGYLQTPIASTHYSYGISSTVIEEFDDYKLCRYVLRSDQDKNGSRFNDMVLGMTLGASYRIGNHIGVEVMYRHSFDGTFSDSFNDVFSFNTNYGAFKNRSVLIGISYKFGDHKGHEEGVEKL